MKKPITIKIFEKAIFLIALTFFSGTLCAQNETYKLINWYKSGNILSQSIVASMVEDADGNLLMVNGTKMVMFDGLRSKTWDDKKKYPEINEEFLGLGKLEPNICYAICGGKQRNFYQIKKGMREIEPIESGDIPICNFRQSSRSLFASRSLALQVVTGIYKEEIGENDLILASTAKLKNSFFVVNQNFAFAVRGNIIYRIYSQLNTIDTILLPKGKWRAFLLGRDLIVENKGAFFRISSNSSEKQPYSINPSIAQLVKSAENLTSFNDDTNDFLLLDSSIFQIKRDNGDFSYTLLLRLPELINVTAIRFNKDYSILFISSINSGLLVASRGVFSSYLFKAGDDMDNIFYAHIRLSNGNILTKYGLFIPQGASYSTRRLKSFLNTYHFFRNSRGFIFESHRDTISKWLPDISKKLKDVKIKGSALSLVRYNNDNILFISSDTSIGIINSEGSIIQYSSFKKFGDFRSVSCCNKKIWLSTESGLVNVLFTARGPEYNLVYSAKNLQTIYSDDEGFVWLCIRGEGIVRYDSLGKITKLPLDMNKALQYVHNFFEDGFGFFWIPTNNGLIQVLKKDLEKFTAGNSIYYYRHSIASGLSVTEFNKDSYPDLNYFTDGELTFPSTQGLVRFKPKDFTIPQPLSPISIWACYADGILQNPGNLQLSYNFSRLSFTFTSPYFGPSENLVVSYRIPQLDSVWKYYDLNNPLEINRLPSGQYTLELQKYKNFGEDNVQKLKIPFSVSTPWFQKTWFYLMSALGLMLFIYLVAARQYKSRLMKARLNEKVIEYELKALRAQINPHFIQNIFAMIAYRVQEFGTERAVDSIRQASNYIGKILHTSDRSVITLEDEIINAEDYLKIQREINQELFSYSIFIGEEVDTIGIQVPSMILQPILENCIKHGFDKETVSGLIQISIIQTKEKLEVKVIDNGKGLFNGNKELRSRMSYGINLTKRRLQILFAGDKNVKIEVANRNDGQSGVIVTIQITLQ